MPRLPRNILEDLAMLTGKNNDDEIEVQDPRELIRLANLLNAGPSLEEFKPGDLVMWKDPKMKTGKWPSQGQPCVVIGIQPGLKSTHESSSNHFNEPNDLCIGLLHGGSFDLFWYDRRRFTHWHNPNDN